MNIPYEIFLTIQMHLTCRKDCVQSPTNKEGWDLFRRTSDDSSIKIPRWRIIWWYFHRKKEASETLQSCDTVERHHWCRSFQLWRSSQEEREGDYDQRVPVDKEEWCLGCGVETWRKSIVSSIWIYKIQHAIDGNIVGYKARFIARGFSWK